MSIMKYFILSFFSFTTLNASVAQSLAVTVKYTTKPTSADRSFIYYDSDNKLTWDDFKKNADDASNAVALTTSGIGFDEELTTTSKGRNTLVITVYCDFNKNASWVKSRGKNDYILNHEQHHFDISFIYAMLFIKKIKETNFTLATCNDQLSNIYNNVIDDLNAMQTQYDSETRNGMKKDKQEEWINKIDAQVRSLKAFEQ